MKILGIIPARYASTRFPGKPLAEIMGKSMIQRVFDQASKSAMLSDVVVATDDDRIADHVKGFGGKIVMTKEDHPSGTDRCFEALNNYGGKYDYVINIQGDEPFIDPQQIDQIAALCDGNTELATLIMPCESHDLLFDTGEVKVVMNTKMEALYFSREVIPHVKGVDTFEWHKHFNYYRHLGMYAYRKDILEQITKLSPSPLEKAESLEQLRWLENGYKIKLAISHIESHCVDCPEDIEKVLKMMGLD